ncbi:hypothetical protein FHL15_004595 [Xylaria flabelliformis]|uniref:C2H2-type domain-containing protein n=1 Tax=Xylaria flabelliformis TaxID=2512241 RepID=A0A553I2L3_9PEZI|nr:hypothetical protein FHL15_004595 [Xylaria flabelliformis]
MTPSGPAPAHDPPASDIYDPDEVFPQNSPLMKPCVLKLKPSPSPPAIPLPLVSLSSSLGRKSSNRRHKIQPSQGDAVLISHLDGGRRPEISQEAGYRPLDMSEDECQSETDSEGMLEEESGDEDGIRSNDMSPNPMSRFTKAVVEPPAPEPTSVTGSVDLRSLASNALLAAQAVSKTTDVDDLQSPTHETENSQRTVLVELAVGRPREMSITNTKRPVLAPPVSSYPVHGSPEMYSPRQHTPSQVLMHPNNVRSPTSLPSGTTHGELAPLQMASPRSDSSNHETLPSIRSQLFEQLHGSPTDLAVRPSSHFPHSPPTGPSRIGAIQGNHASPPISPHEACRNSIPSPANTLHASSPHPYASANNSYHSPPGPDYSGNGAKLERSSINQILTPPNDRIADRMSIDSMTNPQVGCPRSEGGKGFKRKNEMIRHGLVHDSPGHVRVHHVDKDKDDPALRDVLAQRPDGPNRGRRRRGGP